MKMKEIIAAALGSVLSVIILYLVGLINKVPQLLVPSGAIVAFDGSGCPEGWEEYNNAKGKVVIGADHKSFTVGDKGGNATITIEEKNLPPHSHKQKLSGGPGQLPGFVHTTGQAWSYTAHGINIDHKTDGGNGKKERLSNMQPWIALRYCKNK